MELTQSAIVMLTRSSMRTALHEKNSRRYQGNQIHMANLIGQFFLTSSKTDHCKIAKCCNISDKWQSPMVALETSTLLQLLCQNLFLCQHCKRALWVRKFQDAINLAFYRSVWIKHELSTDIHQATTESFSSSATRPYCEADSQKQTHFIILPTIWASLCKQPIEDLYLA